MPDDDRMSGRQPWNTDRRAVPPRGATAHGSGYGYRPSGRRGAAVPPALLNDRSQRRFSELLVPGSVIGVGVLAVVAFAMIVNATMRPEDAPDALPPAQPPALGGLPVIPSEKPVIPIPNASPTGAASTSPTATPSGPAPATRDSTPTRPPAQDTSAGADAPRGRVTISQGGVPQRVDLSSEGDRDWVHWGQENTFSLERRKEGRFAILEGTPEAPRFRHALSRQRFSWVDGSPVQNSTGTPTGIRTCGGGNGFTLTAPADTAEHRLRLYVGVTEAKGRIEAKLPGGGDTASATLESRSKDMRTAVFTVRFRATTSGTVKLSWVTETSFNSECGGVALQAATLS